MIKTFEAHNYTFEARKNNSGYNIYPIGFDAKLLPQNKSRLNEAIKEAKEILASKTKQEVKEAINKIKQTRIRNKLYYKLIPRLRDILKHPIYEDRFFYAFQGKLCIDIFRLDKDLRTPDGVSTKDYIRKTYKDGDRAVRIIERLL